MWAVLLGDRRILSHSNKVCTMAKQNLCHTFNTLTFWQKHQVFQSLHTTQTDNTFQLKPGNQLELKTLLVIISLFTLGLGDQLMGTVSCDRKYFETSMEWGFGSLHTTCGNPIPEVTASGNRASGEKSGLSWEPLPPRGKRLGWLGLPSHWNCED